MKELLSFPSIPEVILELGAAQVSSNCYLDMIFESAAARTFAHPDCECKYGRG